MYPPLEYGCAYRALACRPYHSSRVPRLWPGWMKPDVDWKARTSQRRREKANRRLEKGGR